MSGWVGVRVGGWLEIHENKVEAWLPKLGNFLARDVLLQRRWHPLTDSLCLSVCHCLCLSSSSLSTYSANSLLLTLSCPSPDTDCMGELDSVPGSWDGGSNLSHKTVVQDHGQSDTSRRTGAGSSGGVGAVATTPKAVAPFVPGCAMCTTCVNSFNLHNCL